LDAGSAAGRSFRKIVVMRLLTHVVLGLGVVGACGAGLHSLDPDRFQGLGDAVEILNILAREQRRVEAIDARWQPVLGQMREREAVCSGLAAGHLSLVEAALRFRELYQVAVPEGPAEPMPYPGNSEGERLCREVIDYTEFVFAGKPERSAALKARLTAELQAYLDRSGAITLPDERAFGSLAKQRDR
jgi:hypothetical protein